MTLASLDTTVAIEAVEETPLHKGIKAAFDNTVDVKEIKFGFRVDELGNRRPTVVLQLPVPSVEGLVAIIEKGGPGLNLLLEAAADVVATRVRAIVNDNDAISQDTFNYNEVSWDELAKIEPSERRGGGISKETWAEFAADYIAVMPAVTGRTLVQIENAAKILLSKFSAYKFNKPILAVLRDQLGLYVNSSPNAEQYADCVAALLSKANTLLALTDEQLTANL